METLCLFSKPSKYANRSVYLKARKEAMMDRVEKICKEAGIECSVKDDSPSLQKSIEKHRFSKSSSGIKYKTIYFGTILLIIILLYLLFSLR